MQNSNSELCSALSFALREQDWAQHKCQLILILEACITDWEGGDNEVEPDSCAQQTNNGKSASLTAV